MARLMKDSGIPWIGEIPANWIIRPLKGVAERVIVGLATSVTKYYRDSGVPIFRNLNVKDDKLSDDDILFLDKEWALQQTEKMIKAGDILTVHTGYVGISCLVPSKYHGALTFTTLITTPKTEIINARFLMRYINVSRFFSPIYFFVETGAQTNLNTKAFVNLEISVPSLTEQNRIANFLDAECARIDAIIEQTRATVEEYKKLKQSIITQAVTKGIRPNRHMKDSGIEWIGEIPEEWDVRKIKNGFSIYSGATPKSEIADNWDGDIVWITPADYKTSDKYVLQGKRNISTIGYESCGTTLVPQGSIVFSKRAPIGTVAIAATDLCTNQGCLTCVPSEDICNRFYYYTISVFTEQFNLLGTGTTFKEISYDTFCSFKVPYAPFPEQCEIADYLDEKIGKIDELIIKKEVFQEKLNSYKKSLIYEYVTGKKEVL